MVSASRPGAAGSSRYTVLPSLSYRVAPSGPYSMRSAAARRSLVSSASLTSVLSLAACSRMPRLASMSSGFGGVTSLPPPSNPSPLSNVPA